jgi:hypothetical protein
VDLLDAFKHLVDVAGHKADSLGGGVLGQVRHVVALAGNHGGEGGAGSNAHFQAVVGHALEHEACTQEDTGTRSGTVVVCTTKQAGIQANSC